MYTYFEYHAVPVIGPAPDVARGIQVMYFLCSCGKMVIWSFKDVSGIDWITFKEGRCMVYYSDKLCFYPLVDSCICGR